MNTQKDGAFFALVRGKVQRVGFRYSAYREAARLGLTGWVRNTVEGDVEVWAEGPQEQLEVLLQWLRQGPPRARIDSVDTEVKIPTGAYDVFSIR
jgi:acylphosphatase